MTQYGLHILHNPAGTFHFVGNVPSILAFVDGQGNQPTDKQLSDACQFGPRLAGVRTRVWLTREAAANAAKELGYEVI